MQHRSMLTIAMPASPPIAHRFPDPKATGASAKLLQRIATDSNEIPLIEQPEVTWQPLDCRRTRSDIRKANI
jgi:hypothetical protein